MRAQVAWLCIMMAATLVSCSDDAVTGDTRHSGGRGHVYISPFSTTDTNVYGAFTAFQAKISQPGLTTVQYKEANAAFWLPDSAFSIWAGSAAINGTTLTARTEPSYGTTYSNFSSGSYAAIPLNFDGSYHVFGVAGTMLFPQLTDSVEAPTSSLTMSYPTTSDSVSKSSGFTLTWNGVSADMVHVLIMDSDTTTGNDNFGKSTTDNGSLSISSSDLSNVSTGPIAIVLVRGNYKVAESPSGRKYVLAVYSTHEVHTYLKP